MTFVPLQNYLRMHRKRSCLSQTEIAYLVGLEDGTTVGRHEAGENLPGSHALLCYRLLYSTSTKKLFAGEVEKIEEQLRVRAQELLEQVHASSQRGTRVDQKVRTLGALAYPDDPVIVPLWNES